MKQINTYIIEKLKIDKEVKIEQQITWKWFCDTYHIEERNKNTFFCKDDISNRLLQGFNSLTDKKNNYLNNFIKNCKKDYKFDLGIVHSPKNKLGAERYSIEILLSADKNIFLDFSLFPSDKLRFNVEFFNGTDKERKELKDVLGVILNKIINKDF